MCMSINCLYILPAGFFFFSQWYITFAQITPPKYSQAHMIPAEISRGVLGKKNANTKLSTPIGINTAHRKVPMKRPIIPSSSSILKGFSVNAFMTAIRDRTANAISDNHMQACILPFFMTLLRCHLFWHPFWQFFMFVSRNKGVCGRAPVCIVLDLSLIHIWRCRR